MKMTMREFQRKVRRFTRRMPEAVEQAFREEMPYLVGDAVRTHLSGPKMARGQGDPDNATLARQSGRLASGVGSKIKRAADRVIGMIGVDFGPYPKLHEKGIGKMPARPFLAPTVKRNQDKIKRGILRRIIRKWKHGNFAA